MSIASPSLRSSSTTAPRPSFSSWQTCIVALPRTALTVTGMSYTASSSLTAPLSGPSLLSDMSQRLLLCDPQLQTGLCRFTGCQGHDCGPDLLPCPSWVDLGLALLPGDSDAAVGRFVGLLRLDLAADIMHTMERNRGPCFTV